MDLKILWESLKEPLREAVLAIIPGILAYLGTLSTPWAVALYIILRAVDSYLHELGKATDSDRLTTGLTGF